MSDESNIAAATLLSPLLATNPAELPTNGALDQIGSTSLDDQKSTMFGELLSSNLDANADPQSEGDFLSGRAPLPIQTPDSESPLGSSEERRLSFYPNRVHLAAHVPHTNSASGGIALPDDGETLPLDHPQSIAGILNPQTFSGESDSVDINEFVDSEINSGVAQDSDETVLETHGNNRPDLLILETIHTPKEPQAAHVQASAAANPQITEQSSSRPVVSSPTSAPLGTDASNVGFSNTSQHDNPLEHGNSDLHQTFEDTLDADQGARINAEFSIDRHSKSEPYHTTALASGRSSETGVLPPNVLGANASGPFANGAPTATALPLATDRNLAGGQIAQQVMNFVRRGDDYAEINLSPPHLGKISVRIMLQNDQASVVMTSPTPEVREAIEASLSKLSDLFSEAGIALGDANVSDQNANDSAPPTFAAALPDESMSDADAAKSVSLTLTTQSSLLDAYA